MKKLCFLLLVLFSFQLNAQKEQANSGVIIASDFQLSRPIREIFKDKPVDEDAEHEEEESGDRKHREAQKFVFGPKDGPQYGNDPSVIQTTMGNVPSSPPKANWPGQSASGFRPYDPSGAVGPNHYVQMINSTTFRIYNKSTGAIMLTGTLGNLWSPATSNNGDPIVMYDKAADRWFLAQFGNSTDKKIYIAISQTNDPMGAYYTYTYTSPLFPDYLKFSVWADGYYMTSNQSTQKVFCFNRAEMLAGTAGARSIFVNFSPPKSGFFCPLPGDAADGNLPTYGTPCPIFSYSDNGWGAAYSDAVNIYQMAVNWVPATPTATITLAAAVPTASFNAQYVSTWDDVSQPGTTQKLDGIGGVCMYRSQWKSWAGYNTIVLNWGVYINAAQRSIKWCELRQNQATGVWSLYQEGIYTPDADTRWMGSIAMDNNGSIGLSYLKSNATSIYPGLYYTGRRICDPLGTLPVTEALAVAGTGSQTGGVNRVGDYAHTTLDVDGITFWSTSEYMGGATGSSAARTQIFSYQITPCGNNASVSIVQSTGTNPMCLGANATFTATPFNGGSNPSYQWQLNGVNVGTNSPTYSNNSLTNGQTISCIMTSNLVGVTGSPATSNSITVTVNVVTTPSVSIAQTGGTNPSCSGANLTFTATASGAGVSPTYQWRVNGVNAGTNSATFNSTSITNGQIVTCVVTSTALCSSQPTATSNGITVNITSNLTPSVSIAQTAGSNPLCAGAGATFTATVINGNSPSYQWKLDGANLGTNSASYSNTGLTNGQVVSCAVSSLPTCPTLATLGTGTSTNTTTSGLAVAYASYYGNGRQQYLILASELTALGLSSGNISTLSFNVAGTTGSPSTLNGFTIKMAPTTSTVMTAAFLAPTFTTVFGPVNYTPTLNTWNAHNLSTPFIWDGTSNVLVDICFSNSVVGTVAYQNYQTTTPFVSTVYYQADGTAGVGACTTTTTSGTGSIRPNMRIGMSSGTLNATSNAITMNVNASVTPSISIAQTSGSNPQCAGASATFTATPLNGGTTPGYQWKVNGANVGTNSASYTTTMLTNGQIITCVMTSTASCANPTSATSNAITMNVNASVTPSISIAQTSGSNPQCAGASTTFTATPLNGGTTPVYQWKVNGANVGTNSASYTTTTLTNGQIVTCVMTSTASCANPTSATSNAITMIVNASVTPSISIAQTSGSNPQCAGASATFTATPLNGGTTPVYQWKVNGANVGTNSASYTTTTLSNGQIVTCVMTSTASCANPTSATSNAITMIVNASVTPSISIAQTSGSNPQCAGASATFTATPLNGGTTPVYQWKVNGANVGTNSASYTTTTLSNGQIVTCVMTSTASCANPTSATSNAITMNVNASVTPSISIAQTSGSNPQCAGASATFTATPLNGGTTPVYQWKVNGANVGTNSASYTTTSLSNGQIVTCVMTFTASCASPTSATSNAITMIVNNASISNLVATACNSYLWNENNVTYTLSGIYTFTTLNAANCLHTATLNLTINNSTNNGNTSATACDTYTWNGNTYTSSGSYTFTSLNASGCVNTATLNLTINNNTNNGNTSATACDTYTWNGNTYTTSGSYTFTSINASGCVNTATLNLTINNNTNNGNTSATACDTYTWNGNTYTTSGSYTFTSINASGCVNTATLNLTINNNTNNGNTSATACDTYTWNGNTYTTSGSYTFTSINASGCVNTATLNLTINNSTSNGNTSATACDTYTWNGNTYTTSGSHTFTSINASGCVNTATLNLTINNSTNNGNTSATACDTYTWNGNTYTTSGSYTFTSINASGCVNTATLNLTINQSSNSVSTVAINNTYTWPANGMTYTTSGTYSHTMLNAQGCDSFLVLNLTITNINAGISISPKVLLAGPYMPAIGLMYDSLRMNNMIPSIEPYSFSPFNFLQLGYPGAESLSSNLLITTGNNAIVDWIYVELRSASNPSLVIATKRALLQRDGDIVSHLDGTSPLVFPNELPGSYHVSVKHRNHLGVMTALPINLSSVPTVIDFTAPNAVWENPSITNPPRKLQGNVWLLICGDANANKSAKYNGFNNDKDAILNTIGVGNWNNTVFGYRVEDVNLDSKVRYNNLDNDRAVILNMVGANTPNTVLYQHTPN